MANVAGVTSATAIAAAVRNRELAPGDVVAECFRTIAEHDGDLRSFVYLCREQAEADAKALWRREDLERLPLAGVPVAIKDSFEVAGAPTRVGSEALRAIPADADAEAVARLRAAGAIVVGKTAMPELGIWGTTDGYWGVTQNPRDRGRTPGGSSGGSAAAVAAGLVPLALGSDGLGSIRIPSAACGVPGLKPGEGTVPLERGGDWRGMTVTGAIGSTVADVALATSVLMARPSLARIALDRPLLVAVSTRSPLRDEDVDDEWRQATVSAAGFLARAGHRVVQVDPPYKLVDAVPIFGRWFAGVADSAAELEGLGALDPALLSPRTRRHVRLGGLVRALGGPGDRLKHRWRKRMAEFFSTYDVLITPALARRPVKAAEWSRRGWARNVYSNARYAPFAAPWNLAGTPAGVVPYGVASHGGPLGVQVVAPIGEERTVLSVMAALERGRGGR
jgi:amidase